MNSRHLRRAMERGRRPPVATAPAVQPVTSDGIATLRDHRAWPLGFASAERMTIEADRNLHGGDR